MCCLPYAQCYLPGKMLSAIAQPQNASTSCSPHSIALSSLVFPQILVLLDSLLPNLHLYVEIIFDTLSGSEHSQNAKITPCYELIFCSHFFTFMHLSESFCLFQYSISHLQKSLHTCHTPFLDPQQPICHLEPDDPKLKVTSDTEVLALFRRDLHR